MFMDKKLVEPVVSAQTRMPLTSIYENLTFSQTTVWSWILLNIDSEEYDTETPSTLPEKIGTVLNNYAKSFEKETFYHILAVNRNKNQPPQVFLGIKLGLRNDFNSNKIMPAAFDNLVNLVANAPVEDYLSTKELNYWKSLNDNTMSTLCPQLYSTPATAEELIYVIRKSFYPAMSLPEVYETDMHNGIWGENEIANLVDSKINILPKHLMFTQDIGGMETTGYRAFLNITKVSETINFPYLNVWLKTASEAPAQTDYSIRFNIEGTSENPKSKKTFASYMINVEAGTTEELLTHVYDTINYYHELDIMVSWPTGDQFNLLKESLPNDETLVTREQQAEHNELSLTHIYDNITFSKTDVWVWVEIPAVQYEFLDDDTRTHLALEMDIALANLVTSDEKGVECQMIVSSNQFDSLNWIRNLNNQSANNNPKPYNQDFLYNMYEHVAYQDFREKIVLLGVNIGKRISYAPNKPVSPTLLDELKGRFTAPPVSDNISEKEIEYWKHLARQVSFALQTSRIHAQPALTKNIAYAVRKNFYPAMASPTSDDLSVGFTNSWNKEEVACLTDGAIENHTKFLKITQNIDGENVSGYRATLCFSKFPDVMQFPQWEPWIHYAALLPFPVTFSLRFTLEPSRKVRKEVDHKLKEAKDQANNMESAGGSASLEIVEHINLGATLDYELKKDTTPWVFGRYRLVVEAETEEELREKVRQVIDHYRAMEIHVTWPTGDQFSLLKEGIPNDKVRVLAYYQRQELSIIAAGMPAGSGSTGDKVISNENGNRGYIGPYLGYTTGRIQEPVFLSIHSAIDANNPPVLVITGSPGHGKTFAALTMTYQMALAGTWTIYIDPKADALAMKNLPGLEDTKIVNLKDGNDGILDPFTIGGTISQQMDLAIEVIMLFLGGSNFISDEQNIALSKALEIIVRFPNPTLNGIVDYLLASPDAAGRSLGAKLNIIRKLPFAQLCFSSNTTGDTLRPEDGLTIVTLLGLDLPPATLSREDYGNGNRLAVGIMYLLSSFTKQLMLNANKSQPKAIIIDEAWAITSTSQGAKLVTEIARMGRSPNTALVLVSQNARDFTGNSVTNSVSTRIAFGANSSDEVNDIIDFLHIEPSDINKDTIRNLSNGECLIQDWSGRIARTYVDGWSEEMRKAFETNPQARKNQS